MAARAANDRGSGRVPHGHSKSRGRRRGSRADPAGGAHGRRVRHGTCASPDRSCPARLRRKTGSTRRGRARLRRVAARPRRSAGRPRIGRDTGGHTGDRDRCHAEGFCVPGQPRRLDATVVPGLVRCARGRCDRRHRQAGSRRFAGAGERRAARVRRTHGRGVSGDARAPPAEGVATRGRT